jgi:hypothetical protein
MAERNRYGQERRSHEEDWSREQGRVRPAGDYEDPSQWQQPGNWESGAARGGYGRERSGYGGGFAQWEGAGGGWQSGPGWQSAPRGQGYGTHGAGGWEADEGRFQTGRGRGPSGYGRGGYAGYGSANWDYREPPRSSGAPSTRYGAQDRRQEAHGALGNERWMGEGYGGPTTGELRSGSYDPARTGPAGRSGSRRAQQRWPKSYTRSDERIREDLYERIVQDDAIDATEVSVTVVEGRVTLEGSVPERHMKHDIENLADECPGVKDIDNRIRVLGQGSVFVHGSGQAPGGK